MKNKRLKSTLTLLFLLLSVAVAMAQQKSITIGIGSTFKSKMFDGVNTSFSFNMPVLQIFEVSPTFSYASTMTPTNVSFGWNRLQDGNMSYEYSTPMEGPSKESVGGDVIGSASILIFFKPHSVFGDDFDFGVGMGVGLKQYQINHYRYVITNYSSYMSLAYTKSNTAIEPYWLKVYLNRKVSQNSFVGINASIDGYDGDGIMYFGFQYGIWF